MILEWKLEVSLGGLISFDFFKEELLRTFQFRQSRFLLENVTLSIKMTKETNKNFLENNKKIIKVLVLVIEGLERIFDTAISNLLAN